MNTAYHPPGALEYVMRVLGLVGIQLDGTRSPGGLYVASYDADGNDGRGDVELCADLATAKRYATAMDAAKDFHRISSVRPTREDGLPNRPLTAYAIEVITVPRRTT